MSVLQKVKVNDVDIPEGVTKYDLYKVRLVHGTPRRERYRVVGWPLMALCSYWMGDVCWTRSKGAAFYHVASPLCVMNGRW